MRVVMVSDVYFPRINGVSTAIQTYRQALRAHGVEVSLVTPDYGPPCAEAWITRVPAAPGSRRSGRSTGALGAHARCR